jgi:hypothetical protein
MLHTTPDHPRGRAALRAVAIVATLSLTGCMTGARPSFEETPTVVGTMTNDPAIDAVLSRLDAVDQAVFRAEYSVQLVFGARTTAATVTQGEPIGGRSVTIGGVRFISDGSGRRTCRLDTASCTDGIEPASVSDTGVTPDFAFGDMAKRLRRDAASKIGPATASTLDVGGLIATCVDVPVTGGSKQYCAYDNGVIAKFVGADLLLDMVDYRAEADPSLMTV